MLSDARLELIIVEGTLAPRQDACCAAATGRLPCRRDRPLAVPPRQEAAVPPRQGRLPRRGGGCDFGHRQGRVSLTCAPSAAPSSAPPCRAQACASAPPAV